MEMKSAALIGVGAMGVFFAPRLEAYLGRENFCVIAEGERKTRLETKGVTINGQTHRFPVCEPQKGTAKDLIIMAVKDLQLADAISDIKQFVGAHTQILCVMNGVQSEEQVAAVYGWQHVLYSYMRMSIVMKDGCANFDPYWGRIYFGESKNEPWSARVKAIADFFGKSDIPYVVEPDMLRGLWFKYACNVGENLTCALLGIPFGMFRDSQAANEIRMAAMKEVQAVAKEKGVPLSDEMLEKQYETICRIPYENKPSTLQDLEARRLTEIEMFAGNMVRMGKELGIETPVNWMFLQGIKVLEEKNMTLPHLSKKPFNGKRL